MISEIGLIANPRAGKGFVALAPVHQMALRRGVPMHITNNIGEIAGTLRKLVADRQAKVLLVYGGDGTLHQVIDMLLYERELGRIPWVPLVLPMGGGTMRSVFHWLGWKERPLEILRRVLDGSLDRLPIRKFKPLALTFFNRDKDRVETHYGFIFIMGAVNRVIELYDRNDKSPIGGMKHIALGALGSMTGFPRSHRKVVQQFDASLRADGKPLHQNAPLSVICSVCDSLLFGIKPFAVPAESNQFHALCYSAPAWVVSALVPLEWRATFVPPGSRFFNDAVFSFEIVPAKEDTFFLDGEHMNCRPGEPVRIQLGPEIEFVAHFDPA
jgi:hypothetical protein